MATIANSGYYNTTETQVSGATPLFVDAGGGAGGIRSYVPVATSLTTTGQSALNSATSELLNTLGNVQTQTGLAAQDTAEAAAAGSQVTGFNAQAAGYTAEAGAYGQEYNAYGQELPSIQGEVGAYQTEAQIANTNANLEASAGNIETYQQGLAAKQTIGAQQAAVAAGGFGAGGSALSLLAASTRQASLATALSGLQTNINVQGYKQQAAGATAAASAATGQEAAVVGEQAGATAQEAAAEGAVGGANAAAAAAEGTANVANVAASTATNSAAFNQAIATNSASQMASITSASGIGGSFADQAQAAAQRLHANPRTAALAQDATVAADTSIATTAQQLVNNTTTPTAALVK